MSLFDALGAGLRVAGGTLSPDVYQANVAQDENSKTREAARKQHIAQLIQTAIENGSLDPAAGNAALQRHYGPEAPQLGPSAIAQQRMEGIKVEQDAAKVVQPFLAKDTPDIPGAMNALAQSPGGLRSTLMGNLQKMAEKPSRYEFKTNADGNIIAIDKADPTQNVDTGIKDRPQQGMVNVYPGGIEKAMNPDTNKPEFVQVPKDGGPPKFTGIAPAPTEGSQPQLSKLQDQRAALEAKIAKDPTNKDLRLRRIETQKLIDKETAPAATQASGNNPLGQDPEFWYEIYDKTGKMPPMAWGQSGNPTREAFMKGFPEWKKTHGGTAGDTLGNQAEFKSNASALTALAKDLNTFEPYKKMLDTNADIAIELGRKITQTNAALLNKPLNWIKQNVSSNPDVAEYLAQIRFVQTEAARVINNPRIVGQLTDESRKEMDSVITGNAPIAVVERVLARLKSDGNNRFNAMRDQQHGLIGALKGGGTVDKESGAVTKPHTGNSGNAGIVEWGDLK